MRWLYVLPTVAALCLLVASAFTGCEALASAETGDAWVAHYEANSLVPLALSPPIVVVFGPADVEGLPVQGGWVGSTSTLLLAGRDEVALMHEMGHAFDERVLDDRARRWLAARLEFPPGAPWSNPRRWELDPFCARLICPNERFANVYAGCALGLRLIADGRGHLLRRGEGRARMWWGDRWRTSVARYESVCRLVRSYAAKGAASTTEPSRTTR